MKKQGSLRTYRGHIIVPCAFESSKRWYLSTSINGMTLDERHSEQFTTLKEARDYIDRKVADEKEIEAANDAHWDEVAAQAKADAAML